MSYRDDLLDERWHRRRREIIERGGSRCYNCGSSERLEVHHEAYVPGRRAWEYEDGLLVCLCDACHIERQMDEDSIRVSVGRHTRRLTNAAIRGLRRTIGWRLKGSRPRGKPASPSGEGWFNHPKDSP